jgi:hypothetical protein
MSMLVVVDTTEVSQFAIDFVIRFGAADDTIILLHAFETLEEAKVLIPGE